MADPIFVVHEHHARALHWDLRLERDGALASWAVPKGLPNDPKQNHLAVRVEDHELDYADFEGIIGEGGYGAGTVKIWDSGTYAAEKWGDDEVKVVLHGSRTQGRFAIFRTDGKNWIIHRMDAAARPDWQNPPSFIPPMLATPGALPRDDAGWAFEMKWDGVRAVVFVDGGRVRVMSRNEHDVTASYPELRTLGDALGTTQIVLDGEIVAFDQGRPSFGRLQKRMHVANAAVARKLAESDPATLLLFDVLHLDGRSLLSQVYRDRRALLDELRLAGASWQTPPAFEGGGADAMAASKAQRLEGVVAKRLASRYLPGRRSPDWLKVKHVLAQEVVLIGWKPGQGRREGTVGALLMAVPDASGDLAYVGSVGTGFTDAMLHDLHARMTRHERRTPPVPDIPRPDAKDARWVRPTLVGEVAYSEWTQDDRLRHPSWRGLRPDKAIGDVRRES